VTAARLSATHAALFVVSAAGLIYEIMLTRVFSFVHQHHFAALAIALAVLGLGIGAVWVEITNGRDALAMRARSLIGLACAYPISALAMACLPIDVAFGPQMLAALVPFVLSGAFMASCFAENPRDAGRLLAADLMGASAGIAVAWVLISLFGAFGTIIVLGAAVGVCAWLLGANARASLIGAVAALVLLIANSMTGVIDLASTRTGQSSPDKTMMAVLADPSQQARVTRTVWDLFARVDVVETADPSQKFVFTDGGAGSFMLRFMGDFGALTPRRFTPEFVPFGLGALTDTLILGAGAGHDVLLAKLAGAQSVVAVELNPAMIAVTRADTTFNGDVFGLAGVRVIEGDARNFVEANSDSFDMIYLNVVYSQAARPANQALSESYVFTREAFATYLRRLKTDGRISVVAHNGIEGIRLATTAIAALRDSGVPLSTAPDHLAVLLAPGDDPTARAAIVIVSKQPLSARQRALLMEAESALGLQAMHLPGEFTLAFKSIYEGGSLEDFISKGDLTYNFQPASDDAPFFYNLDPGLPAPVVQSGLTSGVLAIAVALFALSRRRRNTAILIAAGLSGVGFMVFEVALVQRFQLFLGSPVLAFGTVLFALLLGSAAGSMLAARCAESFLHRTIVISALGVASFGIVYLLVLPMATSALMTWSQAARVVATACLAAAPGVPLGVALPALIRLTSAPPRNQSIAVLYALNSAFGVAGASLAVVVAMSTGFSSVLLIGVLIYAALALVAQKV
jgi:SAM-dependent methyltransferase